MPTPSRFLLALFLAAGVARAGEAPAEPAVDTPAPGKWSFSTEASASHFYVGTSRTDGKNVAEQSSQGQIVLTSQYNEGPAMRLGVNWQRFSFSSTARTRLPNTLQSVSLVAGVDFQLFDDFFFRLEAQPGWYSGSSDLLGRSFNIPVVFGVSYLVNKDLQFVLGVSFDAQREYKILGGGGVRWQINDAWLLNFVLPKPRLEYKVNSDLTVFVGGELFEATYRVDGELGTRVNNRKLNSGWLDYFEVRVGGGATYKVHEKLIVDLELGYMAYREASYDRSDVVAHSESGAVYGGLTMRSRF